MLKNGKNAIAVISIMSYYARKIFDETKLYEFRKSPLPNGLINEKIYVYSAKNDKAIIGYFRVSDVLNGNTEQILNATGYDIGTDRDEIIKYYGRNFPSCYALHLYDVTEFDEYLSLNDMRRVSPNINMPQYICFINDDQPLYDVITEWDQAFSLDGYLCDNPRIEKERIIRKAIGTGR